MTGLGRIGRLVLIGVPFLWLALFFLLPLLIVVKISLAESTIGIPPYTPLFAPGGRRIRQDQLFRTHRKGRSSTLEQLCAGR